MIDYLLKNGIVIDGTGKDPIEAHVAIQGERIFSVGGDDFQAREVIDLDGMIVCPGFIDAHAHSEFTILADGRAEGKLSQGVTTEVNGNCGLSAAPLHGEAREHREAALEDLGIRERWSTFREYFRHLTDRGIGINFATLCGHGNLRASVIGYRDRIPRSEELFRMKTLLAEAVEDGAKGLSTGLIYPPGIYARTEELVDLCRVPASKGVRAVYTSHMRDEGDALLQAIEEVLKIGKEGEVAAHISHIKTSGEQNWTKIDSALTLIDQARTSGQTVTCDRYPYVASSTDLDSVLPSWAYEGGVEEELRRLNDPALRKRISDDLLRKGGDYWRQVYISSVRRPGNRWVEGESVCDAARQVKKSPQEFILDLLIEEKTRVGAIFFSMSEDNLKRFLCLPYTMIGSDSSVRSFSGVTATGKPHPRAFGTFPRFLGNYVRDKGLMGLPEAIRKVSFLTARTFGLKDRGLIGKGFYADIAVFDYERLRDTATFQEPFRKAEGVAHVFVNGIPAIRNGEFTGSLAGRVLR